MANAIDSLRSKPRLSVRSRPREWIECRLWIRIEQALAQREVVHEAANALELVGLVETHAEFPFPGFQLIPGVREFTEVTLQATGKQVVVGKNLVGSQTGVQGAVTNTSCKYRARRRHARRCKRAERAREAAIGCVIANRERIERVLRRHADTGRTNAGWVLADG